MTDKTPREIAEGLGERIALQEHTRRCAVLSHKTRTAI